MSWWRRDNPIAPEGYPFVLIAFGILAIIILFRSPVPVIVVASFLPLYVAFFFRDPKRVPPQDRNVILSPADGKIISISEVEEPRYLFKRLKRISIFMSLVSVHINRTPISGEVKKVFYTPGKFLIGFAEKASQENEHNAILIEGEGRREVLFIQIAGFVARRIVCYLKGGEKVEAGARFGLIRFGSRVDLYLPLDCEILVRLGDRVRGGESPLARFI